MTRWEYLSVRFDEDKGFVEIRPSKLRTFASNTEMLRKLGLEGWELCSIEPAVYSGPAVINGQSVNLKHFPGLISGPLYYFKRPISN